MPDPTAPAGGRPTAPRPADPRFTDPSAAEDRAATLAQQVGGLVLAVPGVVRTEPPLTRALARLGRQGLQPRSDGGGDPVADVDVHLVDDHADLAVDLIIADGAQALATTRAVRTALIGAIEAAGLTPGRVTVSVLGVDRG